jgi:predicted ATPase
MVFLSGLRQRPDAAIDRERFPWTLPLVRDLSALEFIAPVTFLAGENGSGKSTLLEGIAAGMAAVAAGAHDLKRGPTLRAARDLAAGFVFIRHCHAHTRLFLRAEDVFGYTGRLTGDRADLGEIERDLGKLPEGPGRERAMGVARGQRVALAQRYGADRVRQGCRFVIATHSPILMALPDATILLAEDGRLRPAAWNDLDHVRVTRAFLNNPAAMLRRLLAD